MPVVGSGAKEPHAGIYSEHGDCAGLIPLSPPIKIPQFSGYFYSLNDYDYFLVGWDMFSNGCGWYGLSTVF
jgi:hypothetical protein